jgi:hypothetical protein
MEESKYPPGSRENPILCKGIDGEHEYLNRLRSPEGKLVEYERKGSVFLDDNAILDVYELSYAGLSEPAEVYMNMYAGGRDKRIVDGFRFETDFLKPALWEKPVYFQQVSVQEYGTANPEWPDKFAYIWSKSGMLLRMGPWIYAKNDFWGCPNPEWNLDELIKCADQVVHQLRGISESRPVMVASAETAHQFMKTMHFELNGNVSEFMKNAGKFEGRNIMSGERAVLYFRVWKVDTSQFESHLKSFKESWENFMNLKK